MPSDLDTIVKLEVPIIVEIASRQMSLDAVLSLVPGAIIELSKGLDEELEINVNNKPIGLGVAVKIGENFGIHITYIGDVKTRINAMSEQSPSEEDAEDLAAQMLAGQM